MPMTSPLRRRSSISASCLGRRVHLPWRCLFRFHACSDSTPIRRRHIDPHHDPNCFVLSGALTTASRLSLSFSLRGAGLGISGDYLAHMFLFGMAGSHRSENGISRFKFSYPLNTRQMSANRSNERRQRGVVMGDLGGLTPEEKSVGYIPACCNHPQDAGTPVPDAHISNVSAFEAPNNI